MLARTGGWPIGFVFSPKKSGPDHAVPVIFRAIADSER